MLYVSIFEHCERVFTNIVIERLIAGDRYLTSRNAGKRIHLAFYFLHLRNRNN